MAAWSTSEDLKRTLLSGKTTSRFCKIFGYFSRSRLYLILKLNYRSLIIDSNWSWVIGSTVSFFHTQVIFVRSDRLESYDSIVGFLLHLTAGSQSCTNPLTFRRIIILNSFSLESVTGIRTLIRCPKHGEHMLLWAAPPVEQTLRIVEVYSPSLSDLSSHKKN